MKEFFFFNFSCGYEGHVKMGHELQNAGTVKKIFVTSGIETHASYIQKSRKIDKNVAFC
jgi:hypothetical protein